MKQTQRKMFRRAMAVLMTAVLTATSANMGNVPIMAAQKKASMNYSAYTLKKGKTVKLKVRNVSKKKKIVWTSSKKKVAAVNAKGVVTAKKKGTTVIAAKLSGGVK